MNMEICHLLLSLVVCCNNIYYLIHKGCKSYQLVHLLLEESLHGHLNQELYLYIAHMELLSLSLVTVY